jgi:hypothetical protein
MTVFWVIDQVTEVMLQAHRDVPSLERAQLSEQRTRAMAEAYGNVPEVVLEKLSHLYLYDFITFGYDMRPPELFASRYGQRS